MNITRSQKTQMKHFLFALLILSLHVFYVSCQQCYVGQFSCSGGTCIGLQSVCDGVNDCGDGSDETRNLCVVNNTCINGLFTCNEGRDTAPPFCVKNSSVCDGISDCNNGADESFSICTQPTRCGPSTYRCSGTFCISMAHVCDGVSDCRNGSDEINCTSPGCPQPSFYCSYGKCISASLICNGVWDCRDGSDEDSSLCNPNITCTREQLYCSYNKPGEECINISDFCSGYVDCPTSTFTRNDCGVDMCERDHPCGANSYCRTLGLGYECYCDGTGFELVQNKKSCRDIDECNETPEVCSQLCENTVGSYKCSCPEGYSSTDVPGQCRRADMGINPQILLANKYFISEMNLDGSGYIVAAINSTFAHVLDYDFQSQKLFHFDVTLKSLHAIGMDGTNDVVLDALYSTSVEGIAVDWIYKKILWTSTQLMGIYVSELNGSFITPVISGVSSNCRGIAVHPKYGYILWTDWGASPFVARVGMDGSSMTKIITTDIVWPNGLTVDYLLDRFWWVDALLDRISYANLDGTGRHVVISRFLSHTYGLTMYDSNLYWTDWNYKSLNTSNRYTGVYQKPLLSNLPIVPYDVKVFHPLRQPPLQVTNPCLTDNGGCTHLCLPSPSLPQGYTCACPQATALQPDGKSCVLSCSSSQFTCSDGVCIPWYYVCNGRQECRGGEDEPPTCKNRTCLYNQFECGPLLNGSVPCISQTSVCDGFYDCEDRSDEPKDMCEKRVCQVWEFLCPSTGKCIPLAWVCDGYIDCFLWEDEAPKNPNCGFIQCKADQFKCNNSRCVPAYDYCDSDDDCGDMSDEPADCWVYRNTHPCSAGYKRCPKKYRCIPITSFCDSLDDCRDGTDELPENCLSCNGGEFTCANKRCIPSRWICDFNNDCGDGSDENVTMCSTLYRNCTSVEFRCSDNRCIHNHLKCDGNKDCADGSDENDCSGCPTGYFKCNSGDCIANSGVCNGRRDCVDLTDELACPTRFPGGKYCSDDSFTCNNTVCIEQKMYICNQFDDCGDGSDESPAACATVQCPANMYQCAINRNCIPVQNVCDGTKQCAWGDDEARCQNCDAQLFQCNSTRDCIDPSLKCDLKYDCDDGSDEWDCLQSDCGKCEQNCTVMNSGSRQVICSCWKGYLINPKNTRTCIVRDDCASLAYNWCPQRCVSETINEFNATYRCVCVDGFSDFLGDGRKCNPQDGLRGALLYGLGNRLVAQNFTNNDFIEVNERSLSVNPSGVIDALDYDARKGLAFWADDIALFRALIPKSHTQMSTEQKIMNLPQATGIAVDWITGNIYWCDVDGVYVTSQSVYWLKKTLYKNASDLFQPLKIVVNPRTGILFYINMYWSKPSIMALDMTGDNQRVIISQNLQYPSDLALDITLNNRLFWVNGGQNLIESCLPDGSDRVTHLKDDRRPYRLDVFSGTLYWTTLEMDQIRMAEGLGQGVKTILMSQQIGAGPIKFVNTLKYNQYTQNLCAGSSCTFCLLGPNSTKCVCPDGTSFKQDGMQCDITPPSDYVPLEDPKICVCENFGTCKISESGVPICVCPLGFTGERCETYMSETTSPGMNPGSSTSTTPSVFSETSSMPSSSMSLRTDQQSPSSRVQMSPSSSLKQSLSTSTQQFSSTSQSSPLSSSSSHTNVSQVPPNGVKSDKGKRDLSIALPVILLSLMLIAIIILIICCCRRKDRHGNAYNRHLDDSSSVSSYPSVPSSPREPVAFQSGSVQFGNDNLAYSNPMYKDIGLVLDPPPYMPSYSDKLDKRHSSMEEGYDQEKKNNALNEGYDQMKPLEFATLPMSKDSDA